MFLSFSLVYQFQHLDSFNLTTVCFAVMWSYWSLVHSEDYVKPTTLLKERQDHHTGNYMPYSFRLVCGIFNVPQSLWTLKGCETGPTVFSPHPRRLESLTICGCNYKGGTFSSVILRPWVLVQPESNSQPPAWQPNAQPSHRCHPHSWVMLDYANDDDDDDEKRLFELEWKTDIEDITKPRGDTKLLLECWKIFHSFAVLTHEIFLKTRREIRQEEKFRISK